MNPINVALFGVILSISSFIGALANMFASMKDVPSFENSDKMFRRHLICMGGMASGGTLVLGSFLYAVLHWLLK